MRASLVLLVVLGACAADAGAPDPIEVGIEAGTIETPSITRTANMPDVDVCALAAELPADDICALICDPTAMAAQLIADGSDRGACYQLSCALPGDNVLVGVCLPP